MRTLHILLALLMLSFVAVQYNDPDGPLWAVIYLIPAAWALLASFLWASTVAGLAGVIYYWPTMSGFWRKDVWWVEETAREGMGMMIAFVVLVVVLFNAHRKPASS
jgi:predicted anti-sigma-YlaC factor YlaD